MLVIFNKWPTIVQQTMEFFKVEHFNSSFSDKIFIPAQIILYSGNFAEHWVGLEFLLPSLISTFAGTAVLVVSDVNKSKKIFNI